MAASSTSSWSRNGTRASSPQRHGHVVDAFDRIVDQHDMGVEPERPVDRRRGARTPQMLAHQVPARIVRAQPVSGELPAKRCVVAVEKHARIIGRHVVGGRQWRIPVVAAEHLVGPLARLHHLDVLRHFAAEQIEADIVVGHHRFRHGVDGSRQFVDQISRWHEDLVMIGLEALRDQIGIEELVALFAVGFLEADGKGFQAALALFGQKSDDDAGINPARQQHPHRHVGDHAAADGEPQGLEDPVAPVLATKLRVGAVALVGRRPVDVIMHGAVGRNPPKGCRRQFAYAVEDGAWRRHDRMQRHVVVQGRAVDGGIDVATIDQGRQGRGETQPGIGLGVIERLDAEAVTGQHHGACVTLDDGEGEHAVKVLHAKLAPGMVGFQDDLGVAIGEKAVAFGLQFPAEFGVVVYTAIEDDGKAQLGIRHRLFGLVGEIDDLQPPVTKCCAAVSDKSPVVGATRPQPVRHAAHHFGIGEFAVKANLTGYSTQ